MSIIEVARAEIDCWHNLPKGLVIAILFCFIHRINTGETFEQSFLTQEFPQDYQI